MAGGMVGDTAATAAGTEREFFLERASAPELAPSLLVLASFVCEAAIVTDLM